MLIRIARVLFALVLFTSIVNADPITVSGTVTLFPGPTPSGVIGTPFVLTGTGFSANVSSITGNFTNFGISVCSSDRMPPSLCTTADLSWQAGVPSVAGTFTINGDTRTISLQNQLSLIFDSEVFVIPPELLDAEAVEVIAPFSFTGVVIPFQAAVVDLTGTGTVSLLLTQRQLGEIRGLFLDHATYTFGPVASGVTVREVPEPATLLLLGSALTSFAMLKKRRR